MGHSRQNSVIRLRVIFWAALCATIVVLSIWAFGALETPAQELALRATCRNNLNAIGVALREYRRVHGVMPVSLNALCEEGLLPERALACPSACEFGYRTQAYYLYRQTGQSEGSGLLVDRGSREP